MEYLLAVVVFNDRTQMPWNPRCVYDNEQNIVFKM